MYARVCACSFACAHIISHWAAGILFFYRMNAIRAVCDTQREAWPTDGSGIFFGTQPHQEASSQ